MFEGKEIPLWTFGQLDMLNKAKLRTRALNLRDALGPDRVPNPPHHEEALKTWILETQCALTGSSMGDFGVKQVNAQGMPLSRAASEAPGSEYGEELGTPAQQAYQDAQQASEIARDRNRGSSDILAPQAAGTDDRNAAYMEAKIASRQAKNRNQGGGNPISWGP